MSLGISFKRQLTSSDDINNITNNGLYYYLSNDAPRNSPYPYASIVEVFGSNSSTTQKVQRVTRYASVGHCSFRCLSEGMKTWGDWNEIATTLDAYYYPGDTITTLNNAPMMGYISSSKTICHFFIPLPKKIYPDVSAIKLTTAGSNISIRGIGGYIEQDVTLNDYAVSATKGDTGIYFSVTKKNGAAYDNATNNTPVVIEGAITIQFS